MLLLFCSLLCSHLLFQASMDVVHWRSRTSFSLPAPQNFSRSLSRLSRTGRGLTATLTTSFFKPITAPSFFFVCVSSELCVDTAIHRHAAGAEEHHGKRSPAHNSAWNGTNPPWTDLSGSLCWTPSTTVDWNFYFLLLISVFNWQRM